ncbi:MAG: hypothetical protein MUE79_09090 [Nitratireductor sp.]|nr:hypothetical protein [Nitratireductor sp.]
MNPLPTALAAMIIALPAQALAWSGDCFTTHYNHNGSEMRLERCGEDLRIVYENPRRAMREIGVRRGTVLFEGRLRRIDRNEFIEGNAKTFRAGCGAAPFYVKGGISRRGQRDPVPFTLRGAAPVRDAQCRKTGTMNIELEFD